MTADIYGRKYARLADLRAGCLVRFDGDHGCLPDQAVRRVKRDASGLFFVECNEGLQYFADDDGVLIGVYLSRLGPWSIQSGE